jgi:hypothetical protein
MVTDQHGPEPRRCLATVPSFRTLAAVSILLVVSALRSQPSGRADAQKPGDTIRPVTSIAEVNPPSAIIATAEDESIHLSWTPSAPTTSGPVNSYRVSTLPPTHITVVPFNESSAQLDDLTNGVPYVVQLAAIQGARSSAVVSTTSIITQAPVRPLAKFEPPSGRAYTGVSTSTDLIQSFNTTVGITTHPAIFNAYTAVNGSVARAIGHSADWPGTTPMVSWNVRMSGHAVLSGSLDTYLTQQAHDVKAYGKPVFLRLDWEMNGSWYPEYDIAGGTSPAVFIASWRYIHKFFAAATNAAFVWSPNIGQPNVDKLAPFTWYPGSTEVDWIAADAYPDYNLPAASAVTGPNGLDDLTDASGRIGKPFMLAEWARGDSSATSDTASTVNLTFDWAEAHPDTVKALVYFDYAGTRQHDLESHPNAAAAFRARTVNNPRYLLDLVGS